MTVETSINLRACHDRYAEEPQQVQDAIDAAYAAARETLESYNLECANDDRAENLVAALWLYVDDSNEGNWRSRQVGRET